MYSTPFYRFRYRRVRDKKTLFLTLVMLLALFLCAGNNRFCASLPLKAGGAVKIATSNMVGYLLREPEKIIGRAMPVQVGGILEDDASYGPSHLLYNFLVSFAHVELHSPESTLFSALPLPVSSQVRGGVAVSAEPRSAAPDMQKTPARVAASGDTLVCIYNTHTGETYSLSDGVERLDRRQGGIVTVAAALQEALEKQGIKTARSDRINDYNYNNSYLESEKTSRELLAANPKAAAILDVHRDSGKTREQSLVKVNGQDAAPVLLIVGSDARRPFPAWRENYAFASELSAKMDEMYPGLSLGVRVKDGQYNQFLHPRAVLVEIGTSKNSTEEAARSAGLFADVLADLLKRKP
ncbi:MAG: stage II sporulation protein P [Eubacteriales bacterium]